MLNKVSILSGGVIMSTAFIIICVLIAIASFALVALILMQKKQAAGFTSAMGGGMSSGQSTYWDKNKKNSMEGKLEFYTKVVAVVYVLLILASNFVK